MSKIDTLAKDFLAQKRIAVVGVSLTRQDAANNIYRLLHSKGYQVYAVNPKAQTFDGDPCYPDLKSIPEKVDGVVIVTRPAVTEQIVRQCIELGIPRVWMHCAMGTRPKIGKEAAQTIGSVSEEAVRLCRENNIAVIPGSCPMQFAGDFGHACMRGVLRLMGALEV